MKSEYDRSKWQEEMKKRHKESYDRREDKGMYGTIFKSEITKDKFWKCPEGEHQIIIVPFLAGKNNPNVKENKPAYYLDLWRHSAIGPNEDQVICRARTFKEECPICEHLRELRKEEEGISDAEYFALSPSRRCIYNVIVMDNHTEEKKGIRIFEAAHSKFETVMTEQAKLPKGGGHILFASPSNGNIISFDRKGLKRDTKFTSFSFLEREDLTEDVLDKAFVLDETINWSSYEEIYALFHQEKGKEGEGIPDFKDPLSCPIDMKFGEDFDNYPQCADCVNHDSCETEKEVSTLSYQEKGKEGEGIPTCPIDMKFGEDFDNYIQCDDCVNHDSCETKAKELEMKKEPTKKPPIPKRRPGK